MILVDEEVIILFNFSDPTVNIPTATLVKLTSSEYWSYDQK